MKPVEEFTIQFSGLSDGVHNYKFDLDKKFFELINSDLITSGNISINATLHKTPKLLSFDFSGSGTIDVECDRCTANIALPVEGYEESFLMVRLDNYYESDNIDAITLPADSSEINIAEHIFEFVNTLLPLSIIPCEDLDDTSVCDTDVLQKLKELADKKVSDEFIDPRWQALKNLKGKDEN